MNEITKYFNLGYGSLRNSFNYCLVYVRLIKNKTKNGGNYNSKPLIWCISSLTTIIAIRAIYGFVSGDKLAGFYHSFIGLGFPFFFYLKRKDLRNIGITLALITIFLRQGWIGIGCLAIAYSIIFWKEKKKLVLLGISLFMTFSFASNKLWKTGNAISDMQYRFSIFDVALKNMDNTFWGQGFGSFKELKENKPESMGGTRKGRKWLARVHSDFLQGIYEFGVLRMFIITFLILLPLAWAKLSPLTASYLCVLFQSFIDFPFHRVTTGSLAILIILLMWREKWQRLSY